MSGIVRDAFAKKGHNAWSCDVLPSLRGGNHYVGDVRELLGHTQWDLMIAHPPCTALAGSGQWFYRDKPEVQADALSLVQTLLEANVDRICVENPVGIISTRIRKPDQYIQPYEFGHDASKKTGLWLKGLPLLAATGYCAPRLVDGRPRWGNQTDSGQNRLGPSDDRAMIRSLTYQGIADAMAEQWG